MTTRTTMRQRQSANRPSRRGVLRLGGVAAFCALSARAGIAPRIRRAIAGQAPIVAAASSLRFVLPAITNLFRRQTGLSLRLAFGSSGNLRHQITKGAPYEMFLSADSAHVEELARAGYTAGQSLVYARGRLAIFASNNSPLEPDGELGDLAAALDDGRLGHFAIANPRHAPYGLRAEQALRHRGLWARLQGALLIGENIAQAARYAAGGGADGGLIAQSLAVAPAIRAKGRSALVPEAWHTPLRQRAVLLKGAGPTARRFLAFLQADEVVQLFEHHGFARPGKRG